MAGSWSPTTPMLSSPTRTQTGRGTFCPRSCTTDRTTETARERAGSRPNERTDMFRRRLSVLVATAALAMGTAACGGGTSSSGGGLGASAKPAGYAMTQATNIPASPTLDAIKSRGKIVIGTKFDQPLFGLKNPVTGNIDGFDAELSRLLAKRVLGDDKKIDFVETVSKNREDFIEQGKVDAVIATYTINDARKQRVGFAGPYY